MIIAFYYSFFCWMWDAINTIRVAFLFTQWTVYPYRWIFVFKYEIHFIKRMFDLPQNGIPSGAHWPLSQTLRAGPSSSKPRSHEYDATVPLSSDVSENVTVLCAGEPGKLHDWPRSRRKKMEYVINCYKIIHN